jgi:hypothetical protein
MAEITYNDIKKMDNPHYCDTHREIMEHVVEGMNIVCIAKWEHPKIKWCAICGARIDLNACIGTHKPVEK